MKAKIGIITLPLAMFIIFMFVPKTFADDGILIAYGAHFEMVCRDDGFVDISHVLLATANITQNVTMNATYSFDGTLVGGVSYEYTPEIKEHDVLYRSENGTSIILVNYNADLRTLKFTKLTLKYTVEGLLKKDVNGTWDFKHTFNSDSISSPEILLKIPKPSQFYKLIIEDTIPAPHVFVEETHYFVLVWKAPLFTFGDVSTTYIDMSYKAVFDSGSFYDWLILRIGLSVGTFFIGLLLGFFSERVKEWLVPNLKSITRKEESKQVLQVSVGLGTPKWHQPISNVHPECNMFCFR